jgi:hypothetical protein
VTPHLSLAKGELHSQPACPLAAMRACPAPGTGAGSSIRLPVRAAAPAVPSRSWERASGCEQREERPATSAASPDPSFRPASAPARAAGKRQRWPLAPAIRSWWQAKQPAQRTPANRLPGSNRSVRPSKANGSVAWPINRALLPVPASERLLAREKLRSLRLTRRRPTADTWKPAATKR